MVQNAARAFELAKLPTADVANTLQSDSEQRRFHRRNAGAITAATMVVIALLWWHLPAPDRASRTVKLSGTSLEGRNTAGQVVWTHQFPEAVSRLELWALGDGRSTDSVIDLDLTGDGALDHLVPVRFGTAEKPATSDALFLFGGDGKVIWSFQPAQQVVNCGDQAFEGPWQLSDVAVSSDPGPKRVWVAFRHHTWWPSFVVELTSSGGQSLRYVQAGWVMTLAEWQTDLGPVLVAGGVLNEHRRASVVLVDMTGPPSVSPAADPQFRCVVQNAVPPRQISLFPTMDVVEAQGHAFPIVYRANVIAQQLLVEADNGKSVVTLAQNGQVLSHKTGDDYWVQHRALSATNRLDHSVENCPEVLQPREIREWTPTSGWRTYSVGSR